MVAPFLDIGENENNVKHLRNRVHILQMAHLKAMQELERCEKMLHAQTNINRELALEIEDLTSRKVSASTVLQSRIKELELLAEERQQKIHQLEAQIRQLKYARAKLLQKTRLSDEEPDLSSSSDEESSDVESISESLVMAARDLAPGEQLLELLIVSGNFDRNVVSGNSSTFILCDFYDFESQTTPLLMGSRPDYSFSSTFKVTVDGFFLRYLASETLVLEVHQAVRGDFKLIGRALVRLSSLLQSKGVLKELTLPVKSIQGHADDKVMGTLSVLLRLSCPISEIWRLHLRSYPQDVQLLAREKKLCSQLSEADFLADEDNEDNQKHQVNELQITVFGCKNLRSYGKKKGNTLSRIPSSYVHYQLLGFPDAFTNIVPETATPEYDLECSKQSFIMEIDACLLRFFAKFRLWLTVFDDQIELDGDDEDDGMIGRCGILLSELTNGETIRGWFSLLDRSDRPVGEISVLIQWRDPFQVLQFISSRRARGALDRPMDLHVLDFDQQHAVMKLFSPDMDGRLNYRQFINLCLPSESLELITSKIKERFEYAIDTQQINSVEDAFKSTRDSRQIKPRMVISDFVAIVEKYGVFLSDAELEIVKTAFAPLRPSQSGSSATNNKEDFVVLHYLFQHVNPRVSCSARLLTHKLRHTVRGFLQQQKQKKPSEFLSPLQVFEKYDFGQSGQVSRAIFKRCLLVFGFELLDIEKEYKDLIKASGIDEAEAASQRVQVTSSRKEDTEEIDADADVLSDSKSLPQQTAQLPVAKATRIGGEQTRSEVKITKPVARPTTVSAAVEFQQRKQAFMDRMKAIASTSSKSLVYEQLESKREQHRIDASTNQSASLSRLDLLNQQISQLHAPQAIHHDAAKTVQHQFRRYRAAKSLVYEQREQVGKCSGPKTSGRFVIHHRQRVDWTTPRPAIEIVEIESKLRKLAHAQAEQVAGKKVTLILSHWHQAFVSADTMNRGYLSRPEFVKVARETLQLPLSDEEFRVLLHIYDRAHEDQVEYEAFVQLNWRETSKKLRAKQVRFETPTVPIAELVQKIRGKFESDKASGTALLGSFRELVGEQNKWVDVSKFALCFKQLGVLLSSDETRAIFETFGEKPDKHKLDYELFVRKTLNLPVKTRRERKEYQLSKEDEERLTSALTSAFKYSHGKFQHAFQKFQEICVVHRFSKIAPSVFWKYMESSGFVDILSKKGVGLLTQSFLVAYQRASKSDQDDEDEEMISLKAVHSFLREFKPTATESSERQQSENEDRGDSSASLTTAALRKLLRYCSDSGIDFRGEFEKFDTQYSGHVTAMEFKQAMLDLGISKFTDKLAPEAVIGQLVRQFRASDQQDAVLYTSMLYHVILSSSIPPELRWYPGVSETLRARIRMKAGLFGKLDPGNPSLYKQLDPCFAHFDRTHKGFLTIECLQQGLAALRYELTTTQVQQLITHMGMFRTGVTCISRMEFDSFVLDPYAVSVLEKLAQDLFVVDSGRHGEVIPRIAQLSCALLSRDIGNSGVLPRQAVWSCLEEILDTTLPQTTKFSIQHLFDVNRDTTIAFRLFMKVISQWHKDNPGSPTRTLSSEKELEKPAASRAPARPNRCSYQDLLRLLYNQLSSLDFGSQIEVVEEHLQRKTRGVGSITLKNLIGIFDQIGIALSKSAEESLPHFFSDDTLTADSDLGDAEIQYDKIIAALKKLHRQLDEGQQHKAESKSDNKRTTVSNYKSNSDD